MTDIAYLLCLVGIVVFLAVFLALALYGFCLYRHFHCCNARPEDEGFVPFSARPDGETR